MTWRLCKIIPNKKARPDYCDEAGASLIALSFFITVLGMLMSGGLYVYNIQTVIQSDVTTSDKLTVIEDALMAYFRQNGRFPCVASMTARPDSNLFGRELPTGCLTPYYSQTWIQHNPEDSSERIHVGALPVRTLGLDDSYIIDGWGRRIVYALDINATSNIYWQFSGDNPGAIYILDDYSTSAYMSVPPQSQPGGTEYSGAQGQIAQLYRDILGREPDEDGLEYWLDKYEDGTSLEEISYGFKNSEEALIVNLYREILNRNPDEYGLEYWLEEYRSGQSLETIRNNILLSDEAVYGPSSSVLEFNLSLPYIEDDNLEKIIASESITNPPGGVIFTVIAPGQDPRGAYNMDGNLIELCDVNVLAGENCDYSFGYYGDNIFVSVPNKTPGTDGNAFTAQLRYQTKFR